MTKWESLVGGQLGQFQIKDELGRGGMAVVYKGYQPSLDRWVAIKTLPQEFAGKREMVSRFHREAEAMVSLNHSNIVQIIDKGEDKGLYYFAMEFVDGPSLQDLLKEQRSKELMFDIAEQVATGLDYAHKKGIVHRDIKPGNVLWEKATSLAKIADFGIARLTQKPEDMITLTATNVGMGTMNYMAPEQKTDAASVDHRADIYSLGVMIYEMFTGTLPMGRFKLPSVLDPSLPKKLDEIVTRCMEPDPADRYASMSDLQADLALARQQAGSDGTLVRSVRDAAERTLTAIAGEQNKGKAGFACCLLLLIGLGGGGYVAYTKGLIPGVGPAQLASKTAKTAKTARTAKTGGSKTGSSSSGDDDDDTKTGETPPPTKTGETPPPTKTGETPPPTKTGETPPPTKTGETPPPTKTGEQLPPTKTGEQPPPAKTGEQKDPPKNGGTKPQVTKLDPAVQREFSELAETTRNYLDSANRYDTRWKLGSAKLRAATKEAKARVEAKPSPGAVKQVRAALGELQTELTAALKARCEALVAQAKQKDDMEIKFVLKSIGSQLRDALTQKTPARITAYGGLLTRLATERAKLARERADAVQAVARQRFPKAELAAGRQLYDKATQALAAGRLSQARTGFYQARDAWLKLRLPTPRRVTYYARSFVKDLSGEARYFGSIAPAPGGRVFAVCKESTSLSTLHLIECRDGSLKEKWSALLPSNTYTVASGGVDDAGNYVVWVGTQLSSGNQIYRLTLDESGAKTGKQTEIPVPEWIHDMVVGGDGRLYVLGTGKIYVYSEGRRVQTRTYDQRGMSRAPIHPRRLAILSDHRAVVSGLLSRPRLNELNEDKSTDWTRVALRTVYLPGDQDGTISCGSTTPIAITGVGTTLLTHDHGLTKVTGRHLIAYPQGERGIQLSTKLKAGLRPALSTDIAYSNGIIYVLDTFNLVEKTILGRERLIAYKVSSE